MPGFIPLPSTTPTHYDTNAPYNIYVSHHSNIHSSVKLAMDYLKLVFAKEPAKMESSELIDTLGFCTWNTFYKWPSVDGIFL